MAYLRIAKNQRGFVLSLKLLYLKHITRFENLAQISEPPSREEF